MAIPVVRPMLATLAPELPRGPEWTYEVKWDGYRTLARKEGPRVKLFSRNLKDATAQYPAVARSVAQIREDAALIDGELVALDEHGHPTFQALHHQSAQTVVFYAFDLLHLNGRDFTPRPIEERRAALAPILEGTTVLRSDPLPGTPAQIEKALRGLRLEGAVAKRQGSRYESGRRSRAWLKVKFNRRQELVVGGYKPNATNFESLLVGYYDRGKLYFAGKVRAGLTPHIRADLVRRFPPLEVRRCPFVNLPNSQTSHWGEGITEEDMQNLRWLKPQLVVEVSFVEWTRDGLLRHSQFVALREDKPAREVRKE
jgi:bifunctional non-homologous end joining protein LigD